jgi:uncharacterized SAM-binding protein YcdF (DUF218 family)
MKIIKTLSISIVAVAMLWAIGLTIFALHSLSQGAQEPERKVDAVVVLTGGKNRIETGLQLFADGAAPQLFITGVNSGTSRVEILGRWRGRDALPVCCITLGYRASTTVQNAQETREWLTETGFRSVRMVTGNYHMNRAWMEFSHALPDIDIYTHPVKQDDLKVNKELLRNLLVSEYHNSLYRWFILAVTPRVDVHSKS